MERLRIAVVTPELPSREYPHRGRSVYQTLSHLCNYAELQAFCPLPRYPTRLRPRFDYRKTDLSYSLPGFPARYFEYPAIPVVTRPVNGFMCARYLEPHIRPFKPDVILNFWLYPAGFAALVVGNKLRVPVVVGSIGSDLNAIPDRISRWFTRKTLQGASRVIAKSEELRLRALALGARPATTHVVANGCDENLFAVGDRHSARRNLNIPQTAELIIFVGRMQRGKGVSELLEAVADVLAKRPNLRLVFIGDGPELKPMQENVRTHSLAQCVTFLGPRPPAEVVQWLAAANLLALPSHAEGCPNAVIEALNCGRPVVATRVGALPQLVDSSCGLLVAVGDVAALGDALNTALSSSWDEQSIAKRFRRSWRQVAQEIFAVCEASCSEAHAQCWRN